MEVAVISGRFGFFDLLHLEYLHQLVATANEVSQRIVAIWSMGTFGERIRELRNDKQLTLRQLASEVGVTFTYLSKVENNRLPFGESPSEALIHKLADALDANEEELWIIAKRIPPAIRERVLQQPEALQILARLDDDALERVIAGL